MSTLDDKIRAAVALVERVAAAAKRPAIMCSFGKDSMVVLHLVQKLAGLKLPVICHREPFLPHKYAFANWVIAEMGLTVYDFPPSATAVQERGDCVEVMNYYPAGARPCALPTGLCDPQEGEEVLCALHDFYLRPTGGFQYPWDYVFHGHKSTDQDPIYGAVPLAADVAQNVGSVSAAFPLRHFTDADVWAYHERFDVPIHRERYECTAAGWRERDNKRNNPDYFPACTACMRRGGGPVACPRLGGQQVSNLSAQLRWAEREKLPYLQPV